MKESSRAHDKTLRQFDAPEEDRAVPTGWSDVVLSCTQHFDYVVSEIEERKNYYKERDTIVVLANQIQERLLRYKHRLLNAKTVKELDIILDSNKSIAIFMRDDLKLLFSQFLDLVKPRSYSIKTSTTRSSGQETTSRSSRYNSDGDRERFPGSIAE